MQVINAHYEVDWYLELVGKSGALLWDMLYDRCLVA